jgi:hypothetical protein
VIAEQKGRRESGSSGGGGRFGLAYFDDAMVIPVRRSGGRRGARPTCKHVRPRLAR